MRRYFITPQRVFPLALVLTLALAFLPGGAFGFTGFLAEVFGMVMTPFTLPLNAVASAVRPAPRELPDELDKEYVEHLVQERNEFERLYVAEQDKVATLEEQLAQIQQIEAMQGEGGISGGGRHPVRLLVARVGLRAPDSPRGAVTLNRGSRHGVEPGTVAVYNAVHLLGRVTQGVSGVQCTLLPLANPATGLIIGAVVPADRNDISIDQAPRIGLEPAEDGTLVGDAEASALIAVGDTVRLFDSAWPDSAQAMVIGRVERVRKKESEPLRNVIVVRPAFEVSQVAYATLKVEGAAAAGAAASAASGKREGGPSGVAGVTQP